MACDEITKAIDWIQTGTSKEIHPVKAYFTKHFGYGTAPVPAKADSVHYAVGDVQLKKTPSLHLVGSLEGYTNGAQDEGIHKTPAMTYDVEIYPDGKLSFLMKLNGQPVGGLPPTVVQATCVDNRLLTTISNDAVVAVGVAQKPAILVPA